MQFHNNYRRNLRPLYNSKNDLMGGLTMQRHKEKNMKKFNPIYIIIFVLFCDILFGLICYKLYVQAQQHHAKKMYNQYLEDN